MTDNPVPDLADRCRFAIQREWLRLKEGAPWSIERTYLLRFIEQDELGFGMPEAWRKVLRLANVKTEEVGLLLDAMRLSMHEYVELQQLCHDLGSYRPFTLLEEDWTEVFNDPPVPELTVSDSFVAQTPDQSPKRRSPLAFVADNRYAFAACLAAGLIGLGFGIFATGGFREQNALSQIDPTRTPQYATLSTQYSESQKANQRLIASVVEKEAVNTKLHQSLKNDQAFLSVKDSLIKQKEQVIKGLTSMSARQSSENNDLRKTVRKQTEELLSVYKSSLDAGEPVIDLKLTSLGGDVAAGGEWETSGPSYTAVQDARPTFRWDPKRLPIGAKEVRVLLFRNGKALPNSDGRLGLVPSEQGEVRWPTALRRGEKYEWLLVSDPGQPELRWLRIPFYLLSKKESAALQAELSKAGAGAGRAAVLARYRLYDDLIQDARAAIRKLATK